MIYEGTISYNTIDKNGNEKTIKENYLLEHVDTFGEVEERLFDEFKSLNALDIIAIKRSKLKEIMNKRTRDDERVYIADVADIQHNDDGEEVEIVYKVALFAVSYDEAYREIKEYLKEGYDMTLVGLRKTRIIDVLV